MLNPLFLKLEHWLGIAPGRGAHVFYYRLLPMALFLLAVLVFFLFVRNRDGH